MKAEPHLGAISSRPDATIVATETFTLVKVSPPAELKGLVLDIALYRERAGRPMQQIEAASLVVPLLIGFSDPFDIALGREPTAQDGYRSFTSGLCLTPVNIVSAGACSCVEITFTPLGAKRFFNLPMSELSDRMIHLDDLEDPSLVKLRERLGNERNWDRRLDIIEAFVLGRMARTPASCGATAWAYNRIVETGGRIKIARLAEKLGWSRKHMASRFRQDVGLPPKAVARVTRFSRAQKLAATGAERGWADVAAACGYADQSHLAREFCEFGGLSPSAWMAETIG